LRPSGGDHLPALLLEEREHPLPDHHPAAQAGAGSVLQGTGEPGTVSHRSLRAAQTARHAAGGTVRAASIFFRRRDDELLRIRRPQPGSHVGHAPHLPTSRAKPPRADHVRQSVRVAQTAGASAGLSTRRYPRTRGRIVRSATVLSSRKEIVPRAACAVRYSVRRNLSMFKRVVTMAGIMTLAGSSLLADFTYQETSTITGGMMMSMMKVVGAFSKQAREPIQATIAVQGDKMMHRTSNSASVIDLASGTITHIDFQKKQYSVMTFEEMKQLMEQMSQKAQKAQKGDKGEMKFKVSANATGKSKQVAGFEAKEMVMKMEMEMEATDKDSGQSQKGGMTVTTDMWIAPGVPGYQEVRDFQKRMSEKLHWTPGGNMFMSDPKVSEGMAEVYKEIARLDGMPVQQFISMGIAGQPGASGAPADGSAPPAQQQPQVERPSVGGALGGALGGRLGLGGLGRKKPADQPAAPA